MVIRISKSERYNKIRRLKPIINKWHNHWKEEQKNIHKLKTKLRFNETINNRR